MTREEQERMILEDVPKVYEAGRNSLKDVVANALVGTAMGTAVALKDVSPISHGLGVRVSSKNLIPYPFNNLSTNVEGTTITDNGDGTITLSGKPTRNVSFALMRNVTIPKGTYYYSNIPIEVTATNMYSLFQTSKGVQTRDRTIVELKEDDTFNIIIVITTTWDGSPVTIKPQLEKGTSVTAHTPYIADTEAVKVRAQGKNLFDGVWEQGIINGNNGTNETVEEYIRSKNYIPVVYGEKYVFSNSVDNTVNAMVYEYTEDFTYNLTTNINIAPNNAYTPSKPTTKYIRFRFNTKALALDSKAQVEIGESVTEHEPYIEPIEYERGEVIKSIYPSTTLTTDTPGALIEVEYNRDINKAFAELQQAIISLGGNV